MAGIQQLFDDLFSVWGDPNLTEKDPLALVPCMRAVLEIFPPRPDAPMLYPLADLLNDYTNGHIGPHFGDDAFTYMSTVYNLISTDPQSFQSFDNSYTIIRNGMISNPLIPPSQVTIGDTVGISAGVREETNKADNWEQIDAIMGGIIETARNNPNVAMALGDMLPQLDAYRKTVEGQALQYNTICPSPEGYFEAHYVSHDLMEQARMMVHTACDMLENNNMAANGFADLYKANKQSYLSKQDYNNTGRVPLYKADLLSDYYNTLEEKIKAIHDMQAKMNDEKGFFHRDSEEYKRMKRCVDLVINIAEEQGMNFEVNYDPTTGVRQLLTDDRRKVEKMSAAITKLFDAANEYVEKEAFKEKKTTRGIERKNTALTLLDLSKPPTRAVNDKAIKDFRTSKKDKRTNVSFSDLVNEEKSKNHVKYAKGETAVLPQGNMNGPRRTPRTHASAQHNNGGRVM